ncbi:MULTISPECIES: molecular chaperone [unclassified Pseudoalteromonas]|uniref:molecular chaperone n=1 Tax=unclassified Pseudoalteromonas TaxID=194690 RepID=UPI00041EF657|nr:MULTISPECIES: molecular chaperone [unclassified Pseudoalteromonas]MAY59790.1 molecular chaperone [Pseudoalteromonas sp.]MDN3404406.1 molecular chaperone [Pseudoalteromonas sp. APC 3218]MDN3408309.1 molecular chaperone [Pseudoalteromonas sp. APC 3894]MDN3411853.1 molecular chaperone [Pseudoalteromonas sp. APC 3250]MDN3415949.1 molecular chaperone [Pseudoalteromonas sp. APC 3227]|tara:strand:- start:21976 stop:23340 length:1365 start_codon:yes stop_codon:yes gene_type:complete
MFVGFDYGSSNCAMGVLNEERVQLIPLEQGKHYLPSTLYTHHSALVVDFVAQHLQGSEHEHAYKTARQPLLNTLPRIKSDLDLQAGDDTLFIGREAISEYVQFPEEGYFVKSPKSFFGATGLKQGQINFFEDIATAMILKIKQRAELSLGYTLSQTVIGRPVNFQAVGGEQSNQQAVGILTRAANRAGFKDVEFLYEPLAAGIDYESDLKQDQKVLVIDIGGGTSDCSFVQMGPSFRGNSQRDADFLAHSGKRVGGNDLDIALSYHGLMPLLGLGSTFKSGLPLPNQPFWQACKINDVNLQSQFYSAQHYRELSAQLRDVSAPELYKRLIHLQQNKQGHQLVQQAEAAKIALTSANSFNCDLAFLDNSLSKDISVADLALAVDDSISQIVTLAKQAITDANTTPDVIYLTGGSAQSPLIKAALSEHLGNIKMVNGDHFGSVTAGLTKWASILYK